MTEPLLRRSESDFVLLSRNELAGIEQQDVALPRHPAFRIIASLAALDLLCSLAFLILFVVQKLQFASLILGSFTRGLLVLHTGLNRNIRSRAFVVAFACLITLLVVLFDSNALVQRLPYKSPPPQDDHGHRYREQPSSLILAFLIFNLAFALTHWIAFVVLIGVSKDRNPYGLGVSSFRPQFQYRNERVVDVEEENVQPLDSASLLEISSVTDSDEDLLEDEIVDIPPVLSPSNPLSSLRSRASHATLASSSDANRAYDTF